MPAHPGRAPRAGRALRTGRPPRPRWRGRLHLLAAFAAPLVGRWLTPAGPPPVRRALSVYTAALTATFATSAAYHRGDWEPPVRHRLKRLDHAMVYVYTAGSYTPFAVLLLGDRARRFLVAVWSAALLGGLLEQRDVDRLGGPLDAYCGAVGWSGLGVLPTVAPLLSRRDLGLLLGGGACLTAGAGVLITRRPDPAPRVFGYHEVGHAVMLVGTAAHTALFRSLAAHAAGAAGAARAAGAAGAAGAVPGAPVPRPQGPVRAGPEPVWAVAIRVLDVVVRLGLRLRTEGLEHLPRTGGVLLAANHVSWLDPVVLVVVGHRAGRRTRFVAVEEAFTRPGSGRLVRAGRHIPLAPGPTGAVAAVRAARRVLAAGEAVLVYPEGTIPRPDQVIEARGGAGMLALTSGVPVVPLGHAGLERGGRSLRRRRAVVVVGPPVDLSDLPAGARGRERYDAAAARVLADVRELAARARAHLSA